MAQFSLQSATDLFKIKYGKLSENTYNSANVLLGRVKKQYNFVGRKMDIAVPTSFAGGVGSGSLPTANFSATEMAEISAKKMYSVIQIDRESVKASAQSEGAFVEMTKYAVQKGVESWMRNMSRALFNDASGSLGAGDGATNVTGAGTSGSPYVVVIGAASWKESNWEEKDFVNYQSETTQLEVIEVVPATRTVKLVGTSAGLAALVAAPGPVPTTNKFYMQNSLNNDPAGLKGILDKTPGVGVQAYGIDVQRRWQSTQLAAGGAGLTTDLMNQQMLEIQRKCGKVPNLIITSFTQYRKLLNVLEDQKRYQLDPRSKDLVGKVSFSGVEFMSSAGPVGVFPERFCEDDRMYMLNDNFIEIHHRPDFGWFDDDGSVFLRTSGDAYEARFGGYLETYIVPPFHGVISGLAT
jgi:hypothetical protein